MTFHFVPAGAAILALVLASGGAVVADQTLSPGPSSPPASATATPPPPSKDAKQDNEEERALKDEESRSLKDKDGHQALNLIQIENTTDGRFYLDGNADLARIRGDTVAPENGAIAMATCTDCQTIAIALQLAIYQQGAPTVAPQNAAVATNANCNRCITIAHAVQYVIPVEDVNDVPKDVKKLIHEINKEIDQLQRIKSLQGQDILAIDAQLTQIENQFDSLRSFLKDNRDERRGQDDGPTPTPTPASTPSITASGTAPSQGTSSATTVTPTPTSTPTPVASTPTPTATVSTSTPTPTSTSTPTQTPVH